MFPFNWLVIIWRGGWVRLKLDFQGQEGGKMLDVAGQVGRGVLENWTVFLDVICVSLLNNSKSLFTTLPNIYVEVFRQI